VLNEAATHPAVLRADARLPLRRDRAAAGGIHEWLVVTASKRDCDMPDHYVWLLWSTAFLVPWAALFAWFPRHRRSMVWASLFTAPFGLTEPLFVPEYWSPPSLFDLARTTGFDIESLVFSFAIGGVAAVLVNVLTGRLAEPLPAGERHDPRHRLHLLALASPFLVFPVLWFLPWNPIYPAIVAMAVGAVATVACRPDLLGNTLLGALIFVGYYLVFLVGLTLTAPGYIERVWNLGALSGWTPFGLPLEELLFAACFGGYWAGVYEHFTWHRPQARSSRRVPGTTSQPPR
jgi:hypothetical protein